MVLLCIMAESDDNQAYLQQLPWLEKTMILMMGTQTQANGQARSPLECTVVASRLC